jgi:heme-degrading monooxygenase HmoA
MAIEALASEGNVIFITEYRVQPGQGDEFVKLFREFDCSNDNVMHKQSAQVKDGVLCRDPEDTDHFYLIGEWQTEQAHQAALDQLRKIATPRFVSLIQNNPGRPKYLKVVMATPAELLS